MRSGVTAAREEKACVDSASASDSIAVAFGSWLRVFARVLVACSLHWYGEETVGGRADYMLANGCSRHER